ncbi:MAG: hypothetical protein HQK99_10395 [Nitrospirae bacterium]|nr:hypothetical protein [Nitrospirota bacterium]
MSIAGVSSTINAVASLNNTRFKEFQQSVESKITKLEPGGAKITSPADNPQGTGTKVNLYA